MEAVKKYSEFIVLAGIILLASILRFYGFAEWSLTNDELSAITRLNYGSFSELITNGVRPDFHPAGVQVFLFYWTHLFGNSVWVVRLPFVLCGIASVFYFYRIVKKWFSVTAAQFAAVSLACLTYPILYSQLARPYSPGLFFSLLLVWHWGNIIFGKKVRRKDLIMYCIATVLCMYTHYFSFVFALMVGASGLLFLKKDNFKGYIGAAVIAGLLFIPHVGITLEQFSRGGIGSWLGKPEPSFFKDYILYAFNDSKLTAFSMLLLFLLAIFLNSRDELFKKGRIISISWFLIPLLFGYFYSVYRNPILQYSVLIFSFPFLLAFLFSYFSAKTNAFTTILLTCFAGLLLYSGISVQKFYSQRPFGVFKELVNKETEWTKKIGRKNISTVINAISPDYLNYYYKQTGETPNFTFIRGDDEFFLAKLNEALQKGTKEFAYAWTNIPEPFEAYDLIRARYPVIVEDHEYFNSRITLFSENADLSPPYEGHYLFKETESFIKPRQGWSIDTTKLDTSLWKYNTSFLMDSLTEFSGGFNGALSDLYKDSLKYISVSAYIYPLEESNIHLVLEFHKQGSDSLYEWHSAQSKSFGAKPLTASQIILTQKLPAAYRKGDKIKVYFWNPDKKKVLTHNILIYSATDIDYEPKYDFKWQRSNNPTK